MVIVQYARFFFERSAEVPAGTFGTRPGVPVYKDMRVMSESMKGGPENRAQSDASAAFGHADVENSGKTYSGTLNIKTRPDEMGYLLLPLFGKVTTTSLGGAPVAQQHIYVPLDDLVPVAPSFGIDLGVEKKREYRYSGCLVDQLVISKTGAQEVSCVFTVVAKDRTAVAYDTAHTPVFSTKKKFQAVQTSTLYGGAVVWEELTITMTRNWDKTKAFSTSTLPDAEIGRWECQITGTLKFENASPNFVSVYEAGTEGEFTFEFRGSLISGANFETLRIELDRVFMEDVEPAHLNESDRKLERVTLTGLVPSSGDWCKVTVINEDAIPATY